MDLRYSIRAVAVTVPRCGKSLGNFHAALSTSQLLIYSSTRGTPTLDPLIPVPNYQSHREHIQSCKHV